MDDEERFVIDPDQEEFTLFLLALAIGAEIVAGLAILVFVLFGMAILQASTAHAQMAPMPLYQHPAHGTFDPYAAYPGCCAGTDCAPWPGEDIEALPNGDYFIKSARPYGYPAGKVGAVIPAAKVRNSFNGQYHLCHTIVGADFKNVDVYEDGTARVFCLFVPGGM